MHAGALFHMVQHVTMTLPSVLVLLLICMVCGYIGSVRNFVKQVELLKENTENFVKSKESYQRLLEKYVICCVRVF